MIISRIAEITAKHKYPTAEIYPYAAEWLGENSKEYELYKKVSENSKIINRSFALPLSEVISLKGQSQRAEIFFNAGAELAIQAVNSLNLSPEHFAEIDNLLFSSCSFPLIPTIDCVLINKLPFRKDVNRLPLFQYGCVGGVSGLRLAKQLSGRGKTLLVSSEICSLIFQRSDTSRTQVIGGALFADGAAAVLLENKEASGITIQDCGSYLIPESLHLMGYDWSDTGAHLRLDQKLPFTVASESEKLITEFLNKNGLNIADIDKWLIHPGGIKILDLLENLFKLSTAQTSYSHKVMESCGNMSSATILHVLSEFSKDTDIKTGSHALMLGIGPGLTIEVILLRK